MLEEIRKYIDGGHAVKCKNALRYDMKFDELKMLCACAEVAPFDAISLAFKYGREKGYRISKMED